MTQVFQSNLLLLTDSYKVSHWKQYPPGTTKVYSFFESRGGAALEVTFFGLQYFIKRYLEGVVVTQEKIDEADEVLALHFGTHDLFNRAGWEYILRVHGGRLPVEIRAVPEGSIIPTRQVLMTIVNTDPAVPWLTNYLETLLSEVWYPSTVAQVSRGMRGTIMAALEKTGDPSLIDFKLHDFGFRGSTSVESAGLGDAAHLVSFAGTDTLEGIMLARRYYGASMPGFSIPAAEHSTITSWGRAGEVDAYRNMLTQFPTGLVAVVSDSYDIYRATRDLWGKELREAVLQRDGILVVRPDSGHPPTVVVAVLELLGEAFGTTTNVKGYRVLNPKVRVIQGDGIDPEMLGLVLETMTEAGWSADNIAFGSGGGLIQKVNRDTQKFAFKCSAIEINGEWRDVMKDPVTDPGKRSKAGRLALIRDESGYHTVTPEVAGDHDLLVPVFCDGALLVDDSFDVIRARARQ